MIDFIFQDVVHALIGIIIFSLALNVLTYFAFTRYHVLFNRTLAAKLRTKYRRNPLMVHASTVLSITVTIQVSEKTPGSVITDGLELILELIKSLHSRNVKITMIIICNPKDYAVLYRYVMSAALRLSFLRVNYYIRVRGPKRTTFDKALEKLNILIEEDKGNAKTEEKVKKNRAREPR